MKNDLYRERLAWQSILRFFAGLWLITCPAVASAAEVVRAALGKDSAWTGEGVSLIVTLYSPGPFSGTASFALPELSKTTFVHAGNPLVGSEQIDDKSYFTQRHEFTIYTQRAGEIVIPSFLVRFAGKKTFTSAAEPLHGFTQELRFQSRRPPGSERLGLVVAARKMEVNQAWQPDANGPVQAGDVISRTISRIATGTTAMMFPPIAIETPAGVRCYASDPIVQDFTQRGDSRAERREMLKYQFERAGTFQLPDLSVNWWDPDAGELKRELLPGATINVRETDTAATAGEPPSSWRSLTILLLAILPVTFLAIALVAWLVRKPFNRCLARWQARRNSVEVVASRRLLSACRAGDARAAYVALTDWKRTVSASDGGTHLDSLLQSPPGNDLQREWLVLSRRLFGNHTSDTPWSGRSLAEAFVRARHGLVPTALTHRVGSNLPALNP